ncbi:MAG: hypothetical protein ACI4KM_10250 [Oscillospiraceae bacterium]
MENVCKSCRKYYPNNGRLVSCPICGDPLVDMPDSKKYSPYSFNPGTMEVLPISVSSIKKNGANKSANRRVSDSGCDIGASRTTISSAPMSFSPYSSESSVSSFPAARKNTVNSSAPVRSGVGIINNYERTNVGEQNFFENASLFFRGLHYGNTRHVITFVDEGDNKTYRVCFYGEFVAAGSPIPQVGDRISIGGKPRGNTYYTENVYLGEDGASRIRLKNQTSRKRTNPVPVIVIAIVLLVLLLAVNIVSGGGLGMLGDAVETFIITTIVTLILGMLFLSRYFRFRTIAIISFVIGIIVTILSFNVGGIAAWLGDFITVIVAGVLVLGLTIFGLWLMIFGGRRR